MTGGDDTLEVVYAVTAPIPILGALPGDEIIFRPQDPDFPLVLRRALSLTLSSVLQSPAVRMLCAESSPAVPASRVRGRRRRAPAATSLRLVG